MSVTFNSTVYAFMRSWYVPEREDIPQGKDLWFAIPAVRVGDNFTPIHQKFSMASMMLIGENRRVLKALRASTVKEIASETMANVQRQAFDVSTWEQKHGPFPYHEMFDGGMITARYKNVATDSSAFLSITSEDPLYTHIRSRFGGRPCNCGK